MAGVTQEAIERIRELIASGEWGPGTRLPREADLAQQLGLSRSSLREAVRALSLARVLEVRQGDALRDAPSARPDGARALRSAADARAGGGSDGGDAFRRDSDRRART